jgi:hypothetical protein
VSSRSGPATLADAARAVGELIAPAARRSMELLGAISLPTRSGCGCEIPAPCWAPQPLGDVTTRACPGSKGVLRLAITNCGMTRRTIRVVATNAAVQVEPGTLALGPMEDGVVTLSLEVPAGAAQGQTQKSIVWIHGCRNHFLRWTVVVADPGVSCSASEIAVEDCPDLVHHWYDHFYCQRPCPNRD